MSVKGIALIGYLIAIIKLAKKHAQHLSLLRGDELVKSDKLFIKNIGNKSRVYVQLTDKEIEELMTLLTELKIFGDQFIWREDVQSEANQRVDLCFQKVSFNADGEKVIEQEGSTKIYSETIGFWVSIFLVLVGAATVVFGIFYFIFY